jgi:tryptophan 7-halogenase
VYSNDYISDDEARATLLANLDGEALAEPRQLKFVTGMRKRFWNKNCVAMGLSSGFLEPLESTSIHFIQSAISKLVSFFPDRRFNQIDIEEYNRQCQFEYTRSRDFLVLHYLANERFGEPFWDHVRTMPIPDTLAHKLELFKASGRFFRDNDELFAESSWVQVFLGQGVMPASYHPLVDAVSTDNALHMVKGVQEVLRNSAGAMPTHQAFIDKYCQAEILSL